MQFPPITVNKTIIRVLLSTYVFQPLYTRMVAHTRLKILRATARYEWKVEDLTHAYKKSLRGFVESSRGQNAFRNVLHDSIHTVKIIF